MRKFKSWLKKRICELLKSDIEEMIKISINNNKKSEDNLVDDDRYDKATHFEELVGHKVEIRHHSQEDSIFVNVKAVMESSTFIRCKDTKEVVCKSKGIVLIDEDKTVYTLANVYEYEIRKREVLEYE